MVKNIFRGYSMRTIIVNNNDSGQRIDKFLTKRFKNMPVSLMYKYIRKKCIKINDKKINFDTILNEGDLISLYISDEFFEKAKGKQKFMQITPCLDIVYQDQNILVVNKPAGMLVHSDKNEEYNTLVNHITAYLYRSGIYNPENENSFAPSLCNRLDRNTQGLVIAAKNSASLKEMNNIIKNHEVEKKYLAVVHGILKQKKGSIENILEKDTVKNIVSIKNIKNNVLGKEAITKYAVINENKDNDLSLMEIELVTGRTHQIRAQMASIDHPLLGDIKYTNNQNYKNFGYKHQALCSYSLRFVLKTEKNVLNYLNNLYITAPLPEFVKLFN